MHAVPKNARLRHHLADLGVDEAHRRTLLAPALPPGSAYCRRTAARLHGFDVRMPFEREARFPLEVAIPFGTEPVSRAGVAPHVCELGRDVTAVEGVPVTDLNRTLLDVARFASRPVALATMDQAAARSVLDREELLRRLRRLRGHRFVAQARALVELADEGAESLQESFCRLRIVDAGFEPPQTQIRVWRPGGAEPFRLDMGWPELGKAVEYDGVEEHENPVARGRDGWRRAYLRRAGWEVLVVGKGEVLGTAQHFERALGDFLGRPWNGRPRRW
ncbi:hypothetical protein [Kineococcus sp. SYSU DK001]|uniref:hypothetical protein n=1 Tax=Kineococcus sp. SYSU DK001 TaxID=3383122 RepID=UPI003D7DB539